MKIIEDIRSVSALAQLCGLLPIVESTNEGIKVSPWGKTHAFLLSSFVLLSSIGVCSVVLFNAGAFKIMQNMQGNTEEINQTIETLFCVTSYTMIAISSISNGFRYARVFQDVSKVDEQLVADGFEGHSTAYLVSVLLAFVSLGLIGVAFFYIHIQSNIFWLYQIILLAVYALQMLYSNLFAVCLRVLLKNMSRRVMFVNEKLEAFTKNDAEKKDNWRELSNLIEILCKFRYITENINTATGVSLLFYMGFAFYTVTNQSYLAFSTLTTHVLFSEKFDTMGLSVAWVLVEVVTMSVICNSCDALSSEANNTSLILARVYGKSKEYENIIDKYLTKSIKQDVQFTAYGFFVIDNSTLFKIFSAVTTYLVILIQFKQLEDSKAEEDA